MGTSDLWTFYQLKQLSQLNVSNISPIFDGNLDLPVLSWSVENTSLPLKPGDRSPSLLALRACTVPNSKKTKVFVRHSFELREPFWRLETKNQESITNWLDTNVFESPFDRFS